MNEFQFTKPKNTPVTDESLLEDLRQVSQKVNCSKLTQKLYTEYGKYDVTTISRRFKSWNKAVEAIGLKAGNVSNYTDESLFENILNIWQHKGKQPCRRDLSVKPSKISQTPYKRRFSTWNYALQAFVEYANGNDISPSNTSEMQNTSRKTGRDPSLRLRFKVLKRDDFTCIQCGASPAKEKNVELHVDHIIPWSKGGETVIENLQTLCLNCNIGKSDLI